MDFKVLKSYILLLLLLLGVVGLFLLFTLLFPVYLLPDGSSARHAVWSPPMKKMDRVYERLTPNEILSMQSNESGKALLEAMKNQPDEKAYPHSYIGSIGEPDFNILGWLTILSFIGWVCVTGFMAYLLVLAYFDMKRLAEEKKKKSLPFDVRRVSDKRR
jgi:Mn2+/Fe2+ NRAMP family transporter